MNSFVVSDVPAEFPTTLEAVKTLGKAISESEAELFLQKYSKNYLASKALLEIFHKAERCKMQRIIALETITSDIEKRKEELLSWARNYRPGVSNNSMTTRMLLNSTNNITVFADELQVFLNGNFMLKGNK